MLELVDSRGKVLELPESKSLRAKFNLEGISLRDSNTKKILSKNVVPRFKGITVRENLENGLQYVEAMSATELLGNKLADYQKGCVLAEEKLDGHRAVAFVEPEAIRLFSKRESKATGWHTENTDLVPHIRDIPHNVTDTIIDGEATTDSSKEISDSNVVQSVMGSTPVNALYNQISKDSLLVFNLFDCIKYEGVLIVSMPLYVRKLYAFKVYVELNSEFVVFNKMYLTKVMFNQLVLALERANKTLQVLSSKEFEYFMTYFEVVNNFNTLYQDKVSQGLEGLMLKDFYARYFASKSLAFVKMKERRLYDVVIMGEGKATDDYKGTKDIWYYFEDSKGKKIYEPDGLAVDTKGLKPISSLAYKGLISNIDCGAYDAKGKLVYVATVSGFTEEVARLLTENLNDYIGEPIEIEGQSVLDKTKASIRHPRFNRFRPDQAVKNCTIAKIIEG